MSAVNPLVVASVSDVALSVGNTTVLTYTPSSAGNYGAYVYYRAQMSVALTLTVAWTDQNGAQSSIVVNGNPVVGDSVSMPPAYINTAAGNAISVTATASVGSAALVSASIKAM